LENLFSKGVEAVKRVVFLLVCSLILLQGLLFFAVEPVEKRDNNFSQITQPQNKNPNLQKIAFDDFLRLQKARNKFKVDLRPTAKIPVQAKAIYLTGPTVHFTSRFNQLINFVETTELNSVVIDFKDDLGTLSTPIDVPISKEINAKIHKGSDFPERIRSLLSKDIYPIARIVVFKDPALAKGKPEWSIKTTAGNVWYDRKGISWVDPNNKQVWKYTVDIAKEAAKLGFREIQFDYVRFPTDGNMSNIVYPYSEGKSKKEVIYEFLKYARQELKPYNVFISADVFGLTTSTKDDMNIGQQFEMISEVVDYICPMVYPSHYGRGSYGIPDPNKAPYQTVYEGLLDGIEKAAGTKVIIRPWLQDFSLGFRYGTKEVRAQMQAVYDAGLNEWIFWNAGNRYTVEAYKE